MKLLFDLFPVILFFAAYKFTGENIFVATVAAMVASVAQILWLKLRGRKIEPVLWFSGGLVVVMGAATLYFHNAAFIKWKPTLLYWGFAVMLALGPVLMKRNFIRLLMQEQVKLPDAIWSRLTLAWATFFLVMGGVNLLVAHQFSESTWVNFKLFGTLAATLVFALAQGLYISRFLPEAGDSTDKPAT